MVALPSSNLEKLKLRDANTSNQNDELLIFQNLTVAFIPVISELY